MSKEITATDLTSETFARIKETEPKVDAFLALNEEKRRNWHKPSIKKASLKAMCWRNSNWNQRQHRYQRFADNSCFKILGNFDPIYDATVMDKVYQADMIPVGKLNMDEFAMGASTETSFFKKTKTLGTKQKYLVVHQVLRQLPLQLDKSPYH